MLFFFYFIICKKINLINSNRQTCLGVMSIKSRLGKVPLKKDIKDKSWQCEKCSTSNSGDTDSCQNCGLIGQIQPDEPLDKIWICSRCNAENKPSKKECFYCQLSRRLAGRLDEKREYEKWDCKKCGAQVLGNRKDCFKCKTPKGYDKPPKLRKSWTCLTCGAKVLGKRLDCFRCHTPKTVSGASNTNNFENSGPWRCKSCNTVNSRSINKCANCDTSVEREDFVSQDVKDGDWECSLCSFMNFARRTKCLKCDQVKTDDCVIFHENDADDSSSKERKYLHNADEQENEVIEWECQICKRTNDGSQCKCKFCEDLKSWTCKRCKTENDILIKYCFGCQNDRTSIGGEIAGIHPVWQCHHCGTSNSTGHLLCTLCHKDKTSLSRDEWVCLGCNSVNLQSTGECDNCKRDKPSDDFQNLCITIDAYEDKTDIPCPSNQSNFKSPIKKSINPYSGPLPTFSTLSAYDEIQNYSPSLEQRPSKRRKTQRYSISEEPEGDQEQFWTCQFCNLQIHSENGDCPKCETPREKCSLVNEVTKILPLLTKLNNKNSSKPKKSTAKDFSSKNFDSRDKMQYREDHGYTVLEHVPDDSKFYNGQGMHEQINVVPHQLPFAVQETNEFMPKSDIPTHRNEPYYEKTYILPEIDYSKNEIEDRYDTDVTATEYQGHSYNERNNLHYDENHESQYTNSANTRALPSQKESNRQPRRYLLEIPTETKPLIPSLSTSNLDESGGYMCNCGNYNRISEKNCLRCGLENELLSQTKPQTNSLKTTHDQKSRLDSSDRQNFQGLYFLS